MDDRERTEQGEEAAPAKAEGKAEAKPEAEAEAAPETPAAAAPEAAEAAQALEAARAEIARLTDQWKRALAEIENMRRRAEREREEVAKYAVAAFARDILAVSDNLQRALANIPAEARQTDELLNTLAVGVEATERAFAMALERHGIRRLDPLGEKFDPHFHQAMFEVETSGQPAGTVVQVIQAGYVINDRLLRPALVAVAKAGTADGEEASRVDTTA